MIMKYKVLAYIITVSFFLFISGKGKKEFEGIIYYKTTVLSKTEDFTTPALLDVYGDSMTLYYKKGNYKMVFNGKEVKEIYYLKEKNMQYTVRVGVDTLFYSLCENEFRTIVSSTYTSNAGKVMKRKCNMIVNDLGDSKNHYWFDPSVYVDPANFKKHVFGYVNMYFEKAQAYWLKYKYEGVFFDLTHTATKIKKMKIDDRTFELPNFPEKRLY